MEYDAKQIQILMVILEHLVALNCWSFGNERIPLYVTNLEQVDLGWSNITKKSIYGMPKVKQIYWNPKDDRESTFGFSSQN